VDPPQGSGAASAPHLSGAPGPGSTGPAAVRVADGADD